MLTRYRTFSLALVILTVSFIAQLGAQNPRALESTSEVRVRELSRRVSVTVALVDSIPTQAGAVIARRASSNPHDVILLARRRATGKLLAAAVFTLITARDVGGDTSAVDMTIRVPDE